MAYVWLNRRGYQADCWLSTVIDILMAVCGVQVEKMGIAYVKKILQYLIYWEWGSYE